MSEPNERTVITHLTWLRGSTFNNVWCGWLAPTRKATNWTYDKTLATCPKCLRISSAYELEAKRKGQRRASYEKNYRAMYCFRDKMPLPSGSNSTAPQIGDSNE